MDREVGVPEDPVVPPPLGEFHELFEAEGEPLRPVHAPDLLLGCVEGLDHGLLSPRLEDGLLEPK